jgi:predicted hydrocarbon binding protein
MLEGRLKIGNTINVALRAYTVQRILRHVEQALGEGASSQLLRQAGRDCGESFAQELRAELIQLGENSIVKSGKTSETFRKKLDLWARYDSSTGMGVFDVSHVVLDGNLLKGRIVIRNSFLAFDRHTESHTCSFLEGYIEGVVLHLVDVDTTVRETSCSSITGNGECVFEFAKSAQGIVGTAIFSRA